MMRTRLCGVALGLVLVATSAAAQPQIGTLCQSSPGVWIPCAPGGGAAFNGVLLDAAAGDPVTDTANDAIRVNVVAGAGSGGTAIADDAPFTPATTSVTPAGALFDDVAPDSVNEGDAGAVRMSGNRNMYTTIRDAAGNERGVNVAADGSIAVTVATVPAHAVTNAGTFVVQENGAALTALQLIDNIPITIGSTTSGQSGALVMGAVTTAAPSYTTAQSAPLSLTTAGLLRVAIEAGAGSGGTALADDADFTAGTTSFTPFGGFYQSAVTACTDGDTCAAGITTGRAVKVALANADGSLATYATDSVFGTATYTEATSTGPVVGGVRSDTLSTKANTTNEVAPLQLNSVGALYVQPTAGTSGGADSLKRNSVGTTEDEHEVKGSAGVLYSVTVTNTNAAVRFLRCANQVIGSTTPGTTTPIIDLAIPGSATGAGITFPFPVGLGFSTGLTCWFVTGAADTDVAEVAANEIKALYTFK